MTAAAQREIFWKKSTKMICLRKLPKELSHPNLPTSATQEAPYQQKPTKVKGIKEECLAANSAMDNQLVCLKSMMRHLKELEVSKGNC